MPSLTTPDESGPTSIPLGAVLPQVELPPDPDATRTFVTSIEGAGFSHLLAYDHVLGADAGARPGWNGPYSSTDPFLEVLSFLSWAAGLTTTLELVTGVLILPQRQTALVAKQAATLDLLSKGRLRLGVGIGWNKVEYDGLNEEFGNRGKRLEEQIEVMRALWEQPSISFQGKWHHIDNAGILPLPRQRPLPIWIGGRAEPAVRRAARIADGFFPNGAPSDDVRNQIRILNDELDKIGRDRPAFGVEARISVSKGTPNDWRRDAATWRELGVTHLSLVTMGGGFTTIEEHLDALVQGRDAITSEL
jgi:probable F420-dependent oxidoreductase